MLSRSTLMFVSAFLIFAIYLGLSGGHKVDCGRFDYTERLNGGSKEILGQQYIITICGSGTGNGGLYADDPPDVAEIKVLDRAGHVLVRRYLTIEWDNPLGHRALSIDHAGISYQDDADQKNYVISVPPSFAEQLKAKFLF
ncbi:hypothetical protein [Herbaspirillum sp. VT-16-41]|uniref:hypothetical protein n=1 Tax=Herbaspirillum sp. VT-16-41 TaxID=1953765 RepID=UPI000980DA3F|nr:hypothetical protein [Herbaspirillum sp. VT-16-41]ONN65634.1 hypothetical protein BTM36_16890 [Herbaspirillum sp. VT-16-41]